MKRIRGFEAKEITETHKQLRTAGAHVRRGEGQVKDKTGGISSRNTKQGLVDHCDALKNEKSTFISNSCSKKLESGQRGL